ncbi:Uncharacterised protein [Mycobacteroides abscessus subsp. abscessus]|nr:Uncharacterised protein [Mycobacteroides abscessus subsp. abscessus]
MPPNTQPTAPPPRPPTSVPTVAPMLIVLVMRDQAACSRSYSLFHGALSSNGRATGV